MRQLRHALIALLVTAAACAAVAQNQPTMTGVEEYLASLDYPDSLSLRLTGVFRSMDFETYARRTIDPFDDPSVVGQWAMVQGERYDYELSLASDGDWALRSLALSVLGQAAAKSTTASPSTEMALTGSFVARYGGMMFPHYLAEGETQRDITVRLATLVLPDPTQFNSVQTDDPAMKLARLDVLDFVSTCEQLGGEAVLEINAPEGSVVEIWTIGYPDEAVRLPVNQQIGTRRLPSAPWSVRIALPEGMTVDDLPEGMVNLNLNAAGILPDWLGGGANAVE